MVCGDGEVVPLLCSIGFVPEMPPAAEVDQPESRSPCHVEVFDSRVKAAAPSRRVQPAKPRGHADVRGSARLCLKIPGVRTQFL